MNDPYIPISQPNEPPPMPDPVFVPPAGPSTPKPWALKVFGIANIVLAGFALVSLPMSLMMFYGSGEGAEMFGMGDMKKSIPEYYAWMRILIIPIAIFAGLQLYAGIGLLKCRDGARRLAIACGIFGTISAIVMGYLSMQYVIPFSTENALKQFPQGGAGKEMAFVPMMKTFMQASAVIGIAVSLLPPLANLFFLSRKRVRDYCLEQDAERAARQ